MTGTEKKTKERYFILRNRELLFLPLFSLPYSSLAQETNVIQIAGFVINFDPLSCV